MASPVPVYKVNQAEADKAYEAYCAIMKLANLKPSLLENKYFTALQDTAYARFLLLFEAL